MGRQSPHMNDALFAELLESVREGGAILRGEREASRTLFVADQRPMTDDPELAPDTSSPAPSPYPFKAFFSFLVSGLVYLLLFSSLALVWLRRRERASR